MTPKYHKRVNSFVFAAHYNKKRGRCCVVVGRLRQLNATYEMHETDPLGSASTLLYEPLGSISVN